MSIDSKRRVSLVVKKATLAALIAVVVGCGGGGGGHNGSSAPSPGTVNDGGGGDAGQLGVNGDLTGLIYYDTYESDDNKKHVKLDLATGIESHNPGVYGDNSSAEYYNTFYQGVVAYDIDKTNQQFVLLRQKYSTEAHQDIIQVFSLDKSYNKVASFAFVGAWKRSFHVSPDGKYVSMIWHDYDERETYFSVFDRDGNEVYQYKEVNIFSSDCCVLNGHVWMQDSSGVILSEDNSLYFVDLKSNEEEKKHLIKGFDKAYFYLSDSISISPDGRKIAFTASTGSQWEDMHVFVVNVDGTGLRQLTSGSLEGEWQVNWAKNGRGLFVVSGHESPVYVDVDCHAELFWVNESAENVRLFDDTDPVIARPVKKINSYQNVSNACSVLHLVEPWEQ